ncbi:hypothetical protein ACIF6I_33925, partial [Streptomyces microflavus]|uniref:hypothetical protein n=1 Tax=Streptomyces microflavus TaxID=1919 RepID=UPI0034201CD0
VIGGPGSHFAATATHLYGVATDHRGTFEYSGTPGLWHKMRGATERIFTSPTTLYATDSRSGKLQQYNRSKNTWEPIGDPLSSFAATKNHLYSVSTDLASIYEYSNPPGSWSLIDRP